MTGSAPPGSPTLRSAMRSRSSGVSRGQRGVVIGKFGGYILVHFGDGILDKLAIGDGLQIKASGLGLEIEGFPRSSSTVSRPNSWRSSRSDGRRQARGSVVKEIPAEIVGQAAVAEACSELAYPDLLPADIEKYGLAELRFGDLVLLKDTQTDYGRGYYKGGRRSVWSAAGRATSRAWGWRDADSLDEVRKDQRRSTRRRISENISAWSWPKGITLPELRPRLRPRARRAGTPESSKPTRPAHRHRRRRCRPAHVGPANIQSPTTASPGWTWAWPRSTTTSPSATRPTAGPKGPCRADVTIQGRDRPSPSECAVAILACIGNEAEVVSGEARGGKGFTSAVTPDRTTRSGSPRMSSRSSP